MNKEIPCCFCNKCCNYIMMNQCEKLYFYLKLKCCDKSENMEINV